MVRVNNVGLQGNVCYDKRHLAPGNQSRPDNVCFLLGKAKEMGAQPTANLFTKDGDDNQCQDKEPVVC